MDRPQHMKEQARRLAGLRVPGPKSLRGRAARWLLGFLLLMALLTLLSRAADELTLPRVTLGQPRPHTIDREITGYGKAEELTARAVTAQPGIIVSGVAVKDGSRINEGDPLFTLDRTDAEEKLAAAQAELDQLDMDIRDLEGRRALEQQDKATAASRASQDYAAAQRTADKEVERTARALSEAQKALDGYTPPAPVDTAALERAVQAADSQLKAARDGLEVLNTELELAVEAARNGALEAGEDPDAAEEALRAEYQPRVEAAGEAVTSAEAVKLQAEAKLEEAKNQSSQPDQRETLRQAVELAKQDYERALDSRESALRQAGRAVEDAQRPSAPDSSGEKLRMRREEQARTVDLLAQLLDSGCVVRAPESGTVTGVAVSAGSPTPQGTAVLLAGGGSDTVFTAQVGSDWEKYISPGDPVTLKPSGDKDSITGLEVDSVGPSAIEGLLDVTVRLPEGTLPIGASAELTCLRRSEEYPVCVPLGALHSENGSFYLLVPETVQTILGPQMTARRMDVTVIEKNDTYAALEGSALRSQRYLLYSSKPVNPGDRIRQELS